MDAADVVQDALERAWRFRARFDPARGTATTWLLTIVTNEARRRRPAVTEPLLDGRARDVVIDVDIERAVRRLSERQRLAVELYYYLDLPIAEVATVMGIADGTVKSTLSDARARLEQILQVTE
jgi:RNA polymerase sigma-70 factor (ECF subfamily)